MLPPQPNRGPDFPTARQRNKTAAKRKWEADAHEQLRQSRVSAPVPGRGLGYSTAPPGRGGNPSDFEFLAQPTIFAVRTKSQERRSGQKTPPARGRYNRRHRHTVIPCDASDGVGPRHGAETPLPSSGGTYRTTRRASYSHTLSLPYGPTVALRASGGLAAAADHHAIIIFSHFHSINCCPKYHLTNPPDGIKSHIAPAIRCAATSPRLGRPALCHSPHTTCPAAARRHSRFQQKGRPENGAPKKRVTCAAIRQQGSRRPRAARSSGEPRWRRSCGSGPRPRSPCRRWRRSAPCAHRRRPSR